MSVIVFFCFCFFWGGRGLAKSDVFKRLRPYRRHSRLLDQVLETAPYLRARQEHTYLKRKFFFISLIIWAFQAILSPTTVQVEFLIHFFSTSSFSLYWRFLAELHAHVSRAWAEPYSLGNLPIPENLVITWPYTAVRPHHRAPMFNLILSS